MMSRELTTFVQRFAFYTLCALCAGGLVACGGDLEEDDGSFESGGNSGGNASFGDNGATSGGSNATSGGSDDSATEMGNTNINLGGSQDFGYFRRLLDDNIVPRTDQFDAAGFFAEHHTPLPTPDCGERICLQAMLGVMGNLMNGNTCTLLQVGLNSPIVADEANRPPLNLAVVIDVSGSMATGGKIDFVREGLEKMINALRDTDQLAIITYDDTVDVLFPLQSAGGQRNTLQDLIRGLEAGGSTNLYEGLERGYEELFAHYDGGRQNRVILLSDGEPTTGITDPDQIVAMSRAYNSDGLGLSTIGLGTNFNYALMREMALQADGNYYFIEDAGAVDEVFTEELSYFTVPVAFDLELTLESGADYRFAAAHGTPFWEDTETGGRLEVPSVFLAHRDSHDDVTEDGGRRGGGSALLIELMPRESDGSNPGEADVAHIELKFRDPTTGRTVTQTVDTRYPFSPWDVATSGFFETQIVEKSFVMLNIFVAFQEASAMFYAGEGDAAIGLLMRLVAAARDFEDSANDGVGDVDIQFDIALMEQMIGVIESNGASEPAETTIPEDPWPAD